MAAPSRGFPYLVAESGEEFEERDCREFGERGLLQMYVDGEIGEPQCTIVAVHLERCGACEREVHSFLVLKRVLRRQHVADPEARDPEVAARLRSFAALLTLGCR
jgi:anti-sigma factor RsiW